MMLRRKMSLNGYSVHFVKCGITQHAKKLLMNFISCVMAERIPVTVNNHTMFIRKENIGNLYLPSTLMDCEKLQHMCIVLSSVLY